MQQTVGGLYVPEKPPRRIKQLSVVAGVGGSAMLFVLADDGTIWGMDAGFDRTRWERFPDLPAPE